MPLKVEDLPGLIDPLKQNVESVDSVAAQVLSQLAGTAERRARRMDRVVKRLQKRSKDDPRITTLKSRLALHKELAALHKTNAARIAKLPKRGPKDSAIIGRVLDSKGQPVRALRIRLTDADRRLDIPGSVAATDDEGEFVLALPKGEPPATAGTPELVVVVETSRKKLLHTTAPVKPVAGRALYLEIVLPAE